MVAVNYPHRTGKAFVEVNDLESKPSQHEYPMKVMRKHHTYTSMIYPVRLA